ncbi:hypothetical protein BJX68DRAFT_131552 [Aspergillus pseudodeflectus]|uniref:Uncharacterized protein n=1 Tax=Aspergillus pseudodeflectus TaxID=176178 RepID=A0ABR4K3K6_9EURO
MERPLDIPMLALHNRRARNSSTTNPPSSREHLSSPTAPQSSFQTTHRRPTFLPTYPNIHTKRRHML